MDNAHQDAAQSNESRITGRSSKVQGVCKRFDAMKGHGYITCDDGTGDVFVHSKEIKKSNGARTLIPGERVEFEVVSYDYGQQRDRKAINVQEIEYRNPPKSKVPDSMKKTHGRSQSAYSNSYSHQRGDIYSYTVSDDDNDNDKDPEIERDQDDDLKENQKDKDDQHEIEAMRVEMESLMKEKNEMAQMLEAQKEENERVQRAYLELQKLERWRSTKYQKDIQDQQRKYEDLLHEHRESLDRVNRMESQKSFHDALQCKKQMDALKRDLSEAQRNILEMTDVVGVKQALPTVQETLRLFGSIRDQQHHNTASALKKYVKSKGNKWQKYYIKQVVDEILFEILVQSFKEIRRFKQGMFGEMASALNMEHTLKTAELDGGDDGKQNEEDSKASWKQYVEGEIERIISNRFGSYFKENFQTMMDPKHISQKVLHSVMANEKCSECLKDMEPGEAMESLEEYMIECANICWIMTLQDPALELQPASWRAAEGVLFDEKTHKRATGSDRKSENVLYFVWPAIASKKGVLANQKMEVVQRDAMYTKLRKKK